MRVSLSELSGKPAARKQTIVWRLGLSMFFTFLWYASVHFAKLDRRSDPYQLLTNLQPGARSFCHRPSDQVPNIAPNQKRAAAANINRKY